MDEELIFLPAFVKKNDEKRPMKRRRRLGRDGSDAFRIQTKHGPSWRRRPSLRGCSLKSLHLANLPSHYYSRTTTPRQRTYLSLGTILSFHTPFPTAHRRRLRHLSVKLKLSIGKVETLATSPLEARILLRSYISEADSESATGALGRRVGSRPPCSLADGGQRE